MSAEEIDAIAETPALELIPSERAISDEEKTLMWRTLSQIPETYREPLVLYYREQQSIERVAAALDLSEDAVKQRLSRGRKFLSEQMTAFVEGSLRQSGLGRAFTYGVLGALPMLSASAGAATVGAAAAKGSTTASAAGLLSPFAALLGPIVGIAGAWFGVKASLDSAGTLRERKEIVRTTKVVIAYVTIFSVLLLGLMLPGFWRSNPVLWATLQVLLWGSYAVGLFALILFTNRKLRRVRAMEEAIDPKLRPSTRFQYQSKTRFCGWPLIDVKTGSDGEGKAGTAKGWIAIGDRAYGFIAMGGITVGVISLGGLSIGLFSCGGAALGALVLGGLGVGYCVFAGVGVGVIDLADRLLHGRWPSAGLPLRMRLRWAESRRRSTRMIRSPAQR